ncbi:unnamed protein product [Vitrella brassicaformis CCMP3155]|uniref:EGF-like domain-containing protein n=1 Tax=Vitrella brassicaformis (strain CCMP3155) TaxID=1169540 RepID=A0A0G4FJG7_VITBC|nr:unnamed protein product [Vitrella brassicaformis CCMP3155]|eukprot:CEM13767.1 unnamed protein product [Vitrella brassicaformis CCMP3155]
MQPTCYQTEFTHFASCYGGGDREHSMCQIFPWRSSRSSTFSTSLRLCCLFLCVAKTAAAASAADLPSPSRRLQGGHVVDNHDRNTYFYFDVLYLYVPCCSLNQSFQHTASRLLDKTISGHDDGSLAALSLPVGIANVTAYSAVNGTHCDGHNGVCIHRALAADLGIQPEDEVARRRGLQQSEGEIAESWNGTAFILVEAFQHLYFVGFSPARLRHLLDGSRYDIVGQATIAEESLAGLTTVTVRSKANDTILSLGMDGSINATNATSNSTDITLNVNDTANVTCCLRHLLPSEDDAPSAIDPAANLSPLAGYRPVGCVRVLFRAENSSHVRGLLNDTWMGGGAVERYNVTGVPLYLAMDAPEGINYTNASEASSVVHSVMAGLSHTNTTDGVGYVFYAHRVEVYNPAMAIVPQAVDAATPMRTGEPWRHYTYPKEKDWRPVECVGGSKCSFINAVPSSRYGHTMVVYRTWNLKDHILPSMCPHPSCDETCLTNLTCYGGVQPSDDREEPWAGMELEQCPPDCCQSRVLCERTRDVMGQKVPLDRDIVLMFGGRTYEHRHDDEGRLVYHECEDIASELVENNTALPVEFRSCLERTTSELWRFDTETQEWSFVKASPLVTVGGGNDTDSAESAAAAVPTERYFHSAVLITLDGSNDKDGVRRQFLYVFGGLGPKCEQGICNDLWRYEIPWAAQAFYPRFVGRVWERANVWEKVNDGPGGEAGVRVYGHQMVATIDSEQIYLIGGHGPGKFYNDIYKYRVVSNYWEMLFPSAVTTVTQRLLLNTGNYFDYYITDPDVMSIYDLPQLNLTTSEEGGFGPAARAEFGAVVVGNTSTLVIHGGFRTPESPFPNEDGKNPFPTYSTPGTPGYYLSDAWTYSPLKNRWLQLNTDVEGTFIARRGHSLIALNPRSGHAQLMLFGGFRQDTPFDEVWVLGVDADRENRVWARLDGNYGDLPPPSAYQAMVYSDKLQQVILFGGLTWKPTNTTLTDNERDRERRCLKEGNDDCTEVRSEFAVQFAPGVWMFNPARCPNLCSNRGVCSMGVCLCDDGWHGADCSEPLCPGSKCYVMPFNQQAVCLFCNQRGQCVDGRCVCDPETGFRGEDCSTAMCTGNCSDPTDEFLAAQGECVDIFPAQQCNCTGKYGGYDCSRLFCLNNCSGHGNCTGGVCSCPPSWFGDDCSVFIFTAGANPTLPTSQAAWLMAAISILLATHGG